MQVKKIFQFLLSFRPYAEKHPIEAIASLSVLYMIFFGVINEELLVAVCFFAALLAIAMSLGDSIQESLDERSENIRKDLSVFLVLKQKNLSDLIAQESKILEAKTNIHSLQSYCYDELVSLHQNKLKLVHTRVAKNIRSQLMTLRAVKKSGDPMFARSVRKAIGQFTINKVRRGKKYDPKEVTQNCLNSLKIAAQNYKKNKKK
jgi:hypothetical protein